MPRYIVRLEGLLIFLASVYAYAVLHGSWVMFVVLWLLPDVSLAGYSKNGRVGAYVYNAVHNYILAGAVIGAGVWMGNEFVMSLGAIYTSHVGLDRCLGYGLKYPHAFRDTHIQHV